MEDVTSYPVQENIASSISSVLGRQTGTSEGEKKFLEKPLTKKIIGKPQVTSRGFIFVKENFDLVNATKKKVEEVIAQKTTPDEPANWDYVKNNIREVVGQFLYTKTQRRPMVLPVIIEV